MEGGSPTIVTNSEGGRTTPSVVAYAKNGDRLVGQVSFAPPPKSNEKVYFFVFSTAPQVRLFPLLSRHPLPLSISKGGS
jgi:hypothetical protein